MPLLKNIKLNEKSAYSVWKVTENYEQLSQLAKSYHYITLPDESVTHDTKRKEWIAGRITLATLMESCGMPYFGLYKDANGKPHLNEYKVHISLSHSYPYVVAIINTQEAVGVDIEIPKEKLSRIAPKFLSEDELKICEKNVELLCKYWSAKEALYKYYGRKKLVFKENLLITQSEYQNELKGTIFINEKKNEKILKVEKVEDAILVYTF